MNGMSANIHPDTGSDHSYMASCTGHVITGDRLVHVYTLLFFEVHSVPDQCERPECAVVPSILRTWRTIGSMSVVAMQLWLWYTSVYNFATRCTIAFGAAGAQPACCELDNSLCVPKHLALSRSTCPPSHCCVQTVSGSVLACRLDLDPSPLECYAMLQCLQDAHSELWRLQHSPEHANHPLQGQPVRDVALSVQYLSEAVQHEQLRAGGRALGQLGVSARTRARQQRVAQVQRLSSQQLHAHYLLTAPVLHPTCETHQSGCQKIQHLHWQMPPIQRIT